MTSLVAALPGDGIGPEVTAQALRVLDALGLDIQVEHAPIGATAWHESGDPLPAATLDLARRADAVLFGAVGDDRLNHLGPLRPDSAIGGIRKGLGLVSSLRQVTIPPALATLSPLRDEVVAGTDLMIVREFGGDVYFGQPKGQRVASDGPFPGDAEGFDTMRYAEGEVRRIAHLACQVAQGRGGRLMSADKANVLETSRLWRRIVEEVAAEYPDVTLEHGYADNIAVQIATRPTTLDTVVTANMFGDILSDIASAMTGSIGLPGSALADAEGKMVYEPGHGSAFDIAGHDRANPIAAIRCVALMARYSFGRADLADAVERAIAGTLGSGLRTAELRGGPDTQLVGTTAMTDTILARLHG